MEGCTDRQQSGFLCSPFFGERGRTLYRTAISGDHDLLRRIDVSRLAHLASRSITANRHDVWQLHAENCGHRAHTQRHRFLHVFPALANGAHRIGKSESPSGNMRRIFSQAVSCDQVRSYSALPQNPAGRDRHRQNCRLRNLSQTQLLLGSFETHAGEFVAKRLIGFLEGPFGDAKFLRQFLPHTYPLRSLAGKQKCDLAVSGWHASYRHFEPGERRPKNLRAQLARHQTTTYSPSPAESTPTPAQCRR